MKLYIYYESTDLRPCYQPPEKDQMEKLQWMVIDGKNTINFQEIILQNKIKVILIFMEFQTFLYNYAEFLSEQGIK